MAGYVRMEVVGGCWWCTSNFPLQSIWQDSNPASRHSVGGQIYSLVNTTESLLVRGWLLQKSELGDLFIAECRRPSYVAGVELVWQCIAITVRVIMPVLGR